MNPSRRIPCACAVSLFVAALALSGCGSAPQSDTVTRLDHTSASITEVSAQAQSLTRLSQQMLRQSTGRGAATGAALGCVVGLASASGAQRCAAGLAAGAAIGAAKGYSNGQHEQKLRLRTVNAKAMAQSLHDTGTHLGQIKSTLPDVLAAQDAELAELQHMQAKGHLSQAGVEARVAEIAASRREIAEALTQSAKAAHTTAQNLGKRSAAGQTGLMWHITEAMQLEQDAISTRSAITLF